MALNSMRLSALSDPTSAYYANVSKCLQAAVASEQTAYSKRSKIVIPFKVSAEIKADLERRFSWKIEVKDHGLRVPLSERVAAITYCMGLRNLVALGRDGEEIIALDADLPLLVAKGLPYVKVVRTHLTDRLAVGYALEETQLVRLAEGKNFMVRGAAVDMLDQLRNGGGSRLSLNPRTAQIKGDVLAIDHSRTPVSLRQAVEMARTYGVELIKGVCLFQPEMMSVSSGPLACFPGRYIIDHTADQITYVPEEDPQHGFSHGWSALKSFFLNHECVVAGDTWLVEKHLGVDGIFHYAARRAAVPWSFPVELGANYYTSEYMDWVEISYPTRGGVARGASTGYWRREKGRLPKYMYEKVMSTMLSVDEKRLTKEDVLTCMRNHNNTVIIGGDTVHRPVRSWVDTLAPLAVPILAMAVSRRARASAELSSALQVINSRYGAASEGFLSLFYDVVTAAFSRLGGVSFGAVASVDKADLDELSDGAVDLSIVAREVPKFIEVTQVVGGGIERDCGPMMPGLPGGNVRPFQRVIDRARNFMSKRRQEQAKAAKVPSAASSSSGGVPLTAAVPVVQREQEVEKSEVPPEGVRKKLFEKLVAEQDAYDVVKPPRVVQRFEGATRTDCVPVPLMPVSFEQMQDDYDDAFPGVSLHDAESVPYIAAEADTSVVRDSYMSINDAKREIPPTKMIRRAKCRGGAAGMLPRSQAGLMAALGKRNADVPLNRGAVDFDVEPLRVVRKIQEVCYVDNWRDILRKHLDTGLFQPNAADIADYVPRVESSKAEKLLDEFFSVPDVDMKKWIVMTKGKAKPPIDPGSDTKVPLPQTIMYNESKSMNAMYASQMSRFHDVIDEMTLPGVRFNARESPADHEVWFNTLEPIRRSCKRVYKYQGDSFNFDRSLEDMAFSFELTFYREHGLNSATLEYWKQTMGVKKAVSLMHGIVMHIVLQGLSGIFKTLFRNGLVTWGATVVCANLTRDTLISLDIKGDDYTIETSRPIDVAAATEALAWKFNFSAKLFECDYLYFCSRYWIYVDGWWYWVADPSRKFEAVCAAIVVDDKGDDKLIEKWESLKDDLRNYDNGLVVEELANAALYQERRSRPPVALIAGLSYLANNRTAFFSFYGPAEPVGFARR